MNKRGAQPYLNNEKKIKNHKSCDIFHEHNP